MTAPTRSITRILAGAGPGSYVTLAEHVATHGPLPLPARPSTKWKDALISELSRSGLTGRGGAAFPAARKLDLAAGLRRSPVLLVNAMEGEPISVKDQALLEHTPHLVLDGADLVGQAVGATEIVVCIPADRRSSMECLQRALNERARAGVISMPVRLAQPPGHYAAGEESALADWVAGGLGLPKFRPDKSVPLTIGRNPVLLHNAETLAHVAMIARHGASWFRQAGAPDAPGTTLVSLFGPSHQCVLEIELGTPLRRVLELGQVSQDTPAVLLGGYGGTWLAAKHFDIAMSQPALATVGATMGVGSIGVLPAGSCGLAETYRIAAYFAGQSAGQCGPCVLGLPVVAEDLRQLSLGVGDRDLLARMRRRMDMIDGRGACRLPDGAVRMVRSALEVFADDVRAHHSGRPCPAPARWPVFPTGSWTGSST